MMNRVFGRVLVKETGTGIPDLVIALFDRDPDQQLALTHLDWATLTSAWMDGLGDRIGSILTDVNGNFEFKFEDEAFQLGDQESRPDLLLIVFAPEDSQSAEQPVPLPPQQRILHFSNIPRQDAGRTEAYVIRLPQLLLDKFEIRHPANSTDNRQQQTIVSALDRSFELEDILRTKLDERTSKRLEELNEATARTSKILENFSLSAVPKELRSVTTYFAPGDNLQEKQGAVFQRGIERLQQSGKKKSLRIRLSKKEAQTLGIEILDDGSIAAGTEVSTEKLMAFIRDRMDTTSLETVSLPIDKLYKKVVKANSPLEEILGIEPAQTDADSDSPEDTEPEPVDNNGGTHHG
jgi:hypothetical protein